MADKIGIKPVILEVPSEINEKNWRLVFIYRKSPRLSELLVQPSLPWKESIFNALFSLHPSRNLLAFNAKLQLTNGRFAAGAVNIGIYQPVKSVVL